MDTVTYAGCETAEGFYSNPADVPRITVQLDTVVNADTAAHFLSAISGFCMSADAVEITDIKTDRCTAVISCPSLYHASELESAINRTWQKTSVTTEILRLSEISATIEGIWTELCRQADGKIVKHQRKMEEVQSQMQQIGSGNRKGRGVELNEFLRQEAMKRPLQEKFQELKLQQVEFCSYMNTLQACLQSCSQAQHVDEFLARYRHNFALELGRFDRALPIYARKTDILGTIVSNQVCIILGETGSGKSTQIPQYVYAIGFHNFGTVVCTQPRKVAALSLARHVSREMGDEPGLVGSRVGAQSSRDSKAKLLYMTDHVLLNECLKDPLLSKYSVVIIDEAHERSIYSDLLLGFIKLALPQRRELRVIVMSATIDPDLFVSYFSDRTGTGRKPPVIQISGRAFPVDVYYEESTEDYVTAACQKALEIHREESPGDILVFLTSPIETEKACRDLMSYCGRDVASSIRALEFHGRLQVEDQHKVFRPAPHGVRKIVFATNSAETSVTIPGTRYVIDTGRVKEMSYDAKRNISSLNVQWVTQSSAEQRKGRAGRTEWGKCFRLYTQDDFDQMRRLSVPEILRIHLGQAMLKLMALGISEPMNFDFVEAPSRDAVESALSVLEDLEAYDENGITEVGQQLVKLSLEPRLGKVVLMGIDRGIPLESAIMAAVSTVGGSIFFRAGSEEEKKLSDRKKTRFCDEWGDIVTLVNVYREWDAIPKKYSNKWCMRHSINAKSMRAAKDILGDIRRTFKTEVNIVIPNRYARHDSANEKMARILFECYSSNLGRFSGHEREGYVLAKVPSVAVHVHPSSSLTYIEELPQWVVYEQMLSTSRTFMLNATYVKEKWVLEQIAAEKSKLSLPSLSAFTLERVQTWYIGNSCVRCLLSNKAEAKKELESKARDISENSKCIIDVVSLDGNNGGLLTLYSTENSKNRATALLQSYLDDTRKSVAEESIEDQLLPKASVRLILERGGQIRTLLMPDDFRTVKVIPVSGVDLSEATVREELSRFGEIEKIRHDCRVDSVWGILTFKLPEQAELALGCRQLSQFKLEIWHNTVGGKGNSQNLEYTVKVVAARRPLRGFGYVQFVDSLDASVLEAEIENFDIQKDVGAGVVLRDAIKVQVDKKNVAELYLKTIPTWVDEAIIKTGLQRAITRPNVKITNVILPRDAVPRNSEVLFNSFRNTVVDKLRASDVTEGDYQMTALTPTEKSYTITAYLKFRDSHKARTACSVLSTVLFNRSCIDAALLLKAEFFLSQSVNRFCKRRLQVKGARLQKMAKGPVRIGSKPWKGSVLVTVETTCADDLVLAREKLAPLLAGRRVTLTAKQVSFAKSKNGIRQLAALERDRCAKIRVDGRRSSAFVYAGDVDQAGDAETALLELLNSEIAEVSEDISLRSADYPRGLMKAISSFLLT